MNQRTDSRADFQANDGGGGKASAESKDAEREIEQPSGRVTDLYAQMQQMQDTIALLHDGRHNV